MNQIRRIQIIISYDGTNYCGWQIQENGITIESVLNLHLSELLREEIKVAGVSRTDAGVHALCNIAIFDTRATIPADRVCFALNQRLPHDIRIVQSEEVASDYHPRYQKSIKTYQYKIENSKTQTPIHRLYSYFYFISLDEELMRKAIPYFIGEHDFKSFCNIRTKVETTIRTITDLTLTKEGNIITITVSGNGFLYNMVRIIVGTLIQVGRGIIQPEDIASILKGRNRELAGPTVPPEGLFLYSYSICK